MSTNTIGTMNSASNTTYPFTRSGSLPTNPSLLGTPVSYIIASLICLLIICALIANIFVCLAVYKQRSARRITRYFIINLCVADIFITVISMPVWLIFMLYGAMSASYLLGATFVSMWTHLDILCGTASILSLTSISLDRYIAVSRPYHYVDFMTTKRALQVIGGVWLYSLMVALLRKPLRDYKEEGYAAALFVMIASFLLPLIIIIAAYGSMFRIARRHARDQTHLQSTINTTVKRDLKAAKTIAFVIGTFLCCWAPFIIVSFLFALNFDLNPNGASVAKWLSYLSAVLNPVVYTCVDKQLRRLVWKRFLVCLHGKFWNPSVEESYTRKTYSEHSSPMTTIRSHVTI